MKNVAYAMRCDCCVMSDVENDGVVMSDVAWCKIKMWCEICGDAEMWVWCGIVVDVEWCEMWTVAV